MSAIQRRLVILATDYFTYFQTGPGLLLISFLIGLRVFGASIAEGDRDGERPLVIKIDVQDSRFAVVPCVERDREVEENHAFCGVVGVNEGFAKQGLGTHLPESGKGGVNTFEVRLFGSAGFDLFAIGGGEGRGEVFEEEGQVQAVSDANRGEDV